MRETNLILKKLLELAGGPQEHGYVLALDGEGLSDVPETLQTPTATYTVVRPTSEVMLRHVLWKAAGAPVLALIKQDLAERLPADLVRRSGKGRIHSLDVGEILGLMLNVSVVATEDLEIQRLALDHIDELQETFRHRTLPTVVDRRLLDDLLLDVAVGRRVRDLKPGELLAEWVTTPPEWSRVVGDLVQRQLPILHAIEGRLLAWALAPGKIAERKRRLEALLVHGLLLAVDGEVPESAWGPLKGAARDPIVGITDETLRATLAQVVRQALDADAGGFLAAPWLRKAESLARQLLPPATLASSRDLPLGLDNRCADVVQRIASGQAVPAAELRAMRQHRARDLRAAELDVLEEMARLSRYLESPAVTAAKAVQWVQSYQREGAFADRAVMRLRRGLAASATYAKQAAALIDRVRARRDDENRRFAEQLAAGYTARLHEPDLVPLHRLWSHPLMREAGLLQPSKAKDERERPCDGKLLLVVLDGCSYPSFLDLVEELAGPPAGAIGLALGRDGSAHGVPALSPVPTVTSHARSAIFLGEIPKDPWIAESVWREEREAASDPARFRQNATLGARSRRLFLKGDLTDGGLELIAAVKNPALDVVAVVFNAIDDQIGSSNLGALLPIKPSQVTGLLPSLQAAVATERQIVITADHGHTPYVHKSLRRGDGPTTRFKSLQPGEATPDGFMLIDDDGLGGAPGRKAFAWQQGVYLGQAQVGFHGGCSLEEMVVPLAFLKAQGVAADEPVWWHGGVVTSFHPIAAAPSVQTPPRVPPPPPAMPVQGGLFDRRPVSSASTGWPDEVLRTLDDDEKRVLVLLVENGSARQSAIAQHLKRSPARVGGLLARLVRKLHDQGVSALRRESLPDGEELFTFERSSEERR